MDISSIIDSNVGLVILFCATVAIFIYSHPILGIIFVFVAYELIRRSSKKTNRVAYIKYTPTEEKKAVEMKEMNLPVETSLEESVVEKMAPIGYSNGGEYINSSYKPVSDNIHNAYGV